MTHLLRKCAALAGAGILALSASGCLIVNAESEDVFYRSHGGETILGANIEQGALAVRVASNGCTDKDYFDVDVDREGDSRFTVEFDRTREDHCRAYFPDGVELVWSYAELGLPLDAKVSIANPVGR